MTEKVTEAKGIIVPESPQAAAEQPDQLLVQILKTKRTHGSKGDTDFRLWLFNYIKTVLKLTPAIHEPGNIVVEIGKSSVLFSSHVDTVHSERESDGSKQHIAYDPNFEHIFLSAENSPQSGCLGADDGVGIYLMLKMLAAGVHGRYIFHVGEECGGIGSRAYVSKYAKLLQENFSQVVAFDRRVNDGENPEVIVKQGGQVCASDAYGKSLCDALNKFPFEKPYVISGLGSFTDSKNYRHDVPECVNVGCFYNFQHTPKEIVYWKELKVLVEAVCKIDWSKLTIARKPEAEKVQHNNYYDDMFNGNRYAQAAAKQQQQQRPVAMPKAAAAPQPSRNIMKYSLFDQVMAGELSFDELVDTACTEPDSIARLVVRLRARVLGLEAELEGTQDSMEL